MATLEFIQSSSISAPEILFGDFTENEVASIIYKSSIYNNLHQHVSFGDFSKEEIAEILSISRSQEQYVSFGFDEIHKSSSAPKKYTQKERSPKVSVSTPNPGQVHEKPKVVEKEEQVPPRPSTLETILKEEESSAVAGFAAISTPDRHDIDDVMKALIEEAVKSSSLVNTPGFPLATQPSSFDFQSGQPTTWSNGTHQPAWSNGTGTPAFTNFYTTPTPTQNIWSQQRSDKTNPVWSTAQWSSLFKGNTGDEVHKGGEVAEPHPNTTIPNHLYTDHHPHILSESIPLRVHDQSVRLLGSKLQVMPISKKIVEVVPRGLVNKSTNCFIHAPLQALLVTPLYHIIQGLDDDLAVSPTIQTIRQFFGSFRAATGVVDKLDPPFEPTFVYEMIRSKLPQFNENGRQEDAEEFLGIILSSLHDEMVSAVKCSQKSLPTIGKTLAQEEDGEWQQIGRKNKIQVTRNTSNNEKSPVSELFGGITRSVVSKAGAKESATLQPFLSLQLDIQDPGVTHVNHALAHFTHREQIYINDTKCYRQETLERLPPVLILHLKRFIFDDAAKSCQKLHKEIDFDINLVIDKSMMSTVGSTLVGEQRYRLFGVVYHHGAHTTGGHYSAMVYHPYIQCWINADDDTVTHQDDTAPLKHIAGRSSYLLFYQRES